MFSEVAEIALVASRLGQFQQLLKTRVILILNFTRPHAITYTNYYCYCYYYYGTFEYIYMYIYLRLISFKLLLHYSSQQGIFAVVLMHQNNE